MRSRKFLVSVVTVWGWNFCYDVCVITIHEFIGVIEQKINLTFASSCFLSLHQRISILYSSLEAPKYSFSAPSAHFLDVVLGM